MNILNIHVIAILKSFDYPRFTQNLNLSEQGEESAPVLRLHQIPHDHNQLRLIMLLGLDNNFQ